MDLKFKPGESILCRIENPQPGGYHVKLLPSEFDGFMPSQDAIDIGRVVPATFVCMSENRALMAYAYMIGTTERVQLSTAGDGENAFSVWADAHPRSIKLRRAVDLIMPPFGQQAARQMRAGETNVPKLLQGLARSKFTGCLKSVSQLSLSRSGTLLLNGRVVGCVYTKKPMLDPFPIETAIRLMLDDLKQPQTEVQLYELQEEIVLSMSSLFLGCPIRQPDGTDNRIFVDAALAGLKARRENACVSVFDTSSLIPRCLGFIYRGDFIGAYKIDDQTFAFDTATVFSLVNRLDTRVEVCFLPPEMTSSSVDFGFSFSSALFSHFFADG